MVYVGLFRSSTGRKWSGIESDLNHHAMNRSLDQRSMGENPSSGLPQSESPMVKGADSILSWLGVFGSRSSRDIPIGATIHDLDPHAFSSKDSKQQRMDTMVKKDKKKNMW